MRKYGYLIAIFLYFNISLSNAQDLLFYQLSISPKDPSKIMIEVDTSLLGSIKAIPARSFRTRNNQPTLYCVTSKISQTLNYQEPTFCEKVTWTLTLQEVDRLGLDPTQHIDTYSPDKQWIFISEYNSFPSFESHHGRLPATVCSPSGICKPLPQSEEPPLLLVLGQKKEDIQIKNKTITVQSDSKVVMNHLSIWKPTLKHQLNYISRIFPAPNSSSWQIAFFSSHFNFTSRRGVIGKNTVVVNTPMQGGMLTDESIHSMLVFAAHESVHLLENRQHPVWAAESLAEYYGIKSLFGTGYAMDKPVENWRTFAKNFSLSGTGLIQANENVTKKNLHQYYPIFSIKGAAFWYELDKALQSKHSDLDDMIKFLDFDENGQFSQGFIERLTRIVGEKNWQLIAYKYL